MMVLMENGEYRYSKCFISVGIAKTAVLDERPKCGIVKIIDVT